jgi:hypothetical protein
MICVSSLHRDNQWQSKKLLSVGAKSIDEHIWTETKDNIYFMLAFEKECY